MRYFLFFCFFILASDIFGQLYFDRFVEGLFLDEYPDAAVAFSFRRLDKDYTGNCITVRRVNGDTSNIGFLGNFLDTLSLKSFCGETSTDTCWVRTWFDQSGNARNLRQTTNSNQPPIFMGGLITRGLDGDMGLLNTVNTRMIIPSSTISMSFMHKSANYSFAIVVQPSSIANPDKAIAYFSNNNATNANVGTFFLYDDRSSSSRSDGSFHVISKGGSAGQDNVVNNVVNNHVVPNDINLIYVDVDADNTIAADRSQIYSNNNAVGKNNTTTNTPSTSNAALDFAIMDIVNQTSGDNGLFHELIIWSVDFSRKRTEIRNNINNFYSIY